MHRQSAALLPRAAARCGRNRCSASRSKFRCRRLFSGASAQPLEGARLRPRDAAAAVFGSGLEVPVGGGPKSRTPHLGLGAVPVGFEGSFYQRLLPSEQVPFSSEQGRIYFQEALLEGHMENYFFLAEQFRTQDEPTFCGLSTLAMVLNSLRIDPMRTWKGAWRWFNEQNLGCCDSSKPEHVREVGLPFDMFTSMASCNGADVTSHRAPSSADDTAALDEFGKLFRATVSAISKSRERECVVACYSRAALGQTGEGHFSPIGGYHEGSDSVLIMDVARFKYPPHWVPINHLVKAMACVDVDTGRPRGFMKLRLRQQLAADRRLSVPVYAPFMPAAAGRLLSQQLQEALTESRLTSAAGMHRWLLAASRVEPQVLTQVLQVGDLDALREVFHRLANFPLFVELCEAYERNCCVTHLFPPLRFLHHAGSTDSAGAWLPAGEEVQFGLKYCGELWVLLLLLLPEHLRVAVSEEFAGPWVAYGIAKSVRGPWALPLDALRETLAQRLPPPAGDCGAQRSRHAALMS